MKAEREKALRTYYLWPFFVGIVILISAVTGVFLNREVGLWLLGFAALYYLATLIVYLIIRSRLERKIVEFGAGYAQVQNELLRRTSIPFALSDGEGELLWMNPAFKRTFFGKEKVEGRLSKLFPETSELEFKSLTEMHVAFGERRYAVHCSEVSMDTVEAFNDLSFGGDRDLILLYFQDETETLFYKKKMEDEAAVVALLYFDNYEDVLSNVESVRRSLLSALLERKLNEHVDALHGVIRKLEKDRYFLVFQQQALSKLMESKFALLDEIKRVNIGNDVQVTASIGVGVGGSNYDQNFEYARTAIEMALGRGGDQAVVKNREKVSYFGGKAQSTERNTRVKARVKAHALRELIEAKESVMIMGHPISDMDCIGAAMGIYRAARFSGKNAHVVIGEVSNSVKPILSTFGEGSGYEGDLFLNCEEAKERITPNTLLVVVDTNRPGYTVCPELLKMTQSIVVLDHHRQGVETIENALVSYVEPFASSASEMVAEIVQYYDEKLRLKPAEADAVFAGIVIDTNNFEDKSGVRTFEAAAYLRRCGADSTRVRKYFRDSMEDYKLRAETVRRAEIYKNDYIISVCPNLEPNPNQTIVAAQAANELLEIRGIKASFVLTEYEGKIYVSARSIDEVNVQVMMEKLGGGGHLSVAGTQFKGITIEEALEKLKAVLEEDA